MHAMRFMVLALLLPLTALAQPVDRWRDQRALFEQAWRDAGRGNAEALERAWKQLGDYPLAPYLRFEWLRQNAARVEPAEMAAFLQRYRDWSFVDGLEQHWLNRLAATGKLDALLRYGATARNAETRCLLERARLERGITEGLLERTRELWLSAKSRPRACDPLFNWWRSQGQPDFDTTWQRFGLAMDAGETSLARYLKRYLPAQETALADGWIEMRSRPISTLDRAGSWPDRELARRILAWGLVRLAERDWQRAAELHDALNTRFAFTDDEIGPARRQIALFQAVDLNPNAIDRIDALGAYSRDPQLLEWRARVALANQRWETVIETVARMPESLYNQNKWRYWRARALESMDSESPGPAEAATVFANLARESDYYGFLAAARTGRPLRLCSRELVPESARQRALYEMPEFVRALELRRAGLDWHARWTWQRHIAALEPALLEQAALAASAIGWYDRAITSLAGAGAVNAYRWRFPLLERERILAESARQGVDPALVLGMMRAESAMQADARSPADARGLLQLIDSTARAVGRRHGIPYSGATDLYRPDRNIALGVAHLGELLQRFNGDWTRVAAAYNAGIGNAERWHAERSGLPSDIWIETLSFHETRDYIPRVLAFATIYEWQLERRPSLMAESLIDPTPTQSGFDCADG